MLGDFEGAEDVLALGEVLTVFDADNCCTNDLPVALALGGVLPADLCPEDVCAVEYLEVLGPIDFYFVGDVGTLDDGGVVAVASLN